ncbi:Signal transduction histidine kinase [Chitinophaga sp. CF118]|uniref:hybrid sensor histidine kinase/response regulator transcription factor n=1 Tax=Chitinophaga sp. CF118 TaxID=1884367 RepID=UPI0008E95514|nr:two-component regulator propeller domain-containing protein [Chitinophaga sp. CF118]SFD55661.1 Signal transduction histidine kinase [Chitinophaga sp. CF118]
MRLQQWILLFLLLIAGHSYAQAISDPDSNIRLEQLTTRDGLSQNTIRCLLQDKKGFIWIGTLNGLNRYDGRKFIVYRPEYGNPNSISDNRIRELHEDKQGLIWVKTIEGRFHCFDPRKESFVEYLPDSVVKSYDHFFEASNGEIWLYGKANGSLRIRKQKKHFITQCYNKQQPVNFVSEDSRQGIWIGTTGGLFRLKNDEQEIVFRGNFIQAITDQQQVYFITRQSGIFTLAGQQFNIPEGIQLTNAALLAGSRLLLGTQQSGVFVADLLSGQITPGNQLLGESITGHIDVITDPQHRIWINNHSGIVWYYDIIKQKTTRMELIPPAVMRLIDDCRYSFFSDNKHHTWITTYGGGLYCYNHVTDKLQHFSSTPDNPNGLSSNYLLSILEDRAGLIWVGAEHTGLNKLVPQSLNVAHIFPEETSSGRYTANSIKTIYEDSHDRLWVSTRNGALYLYNSKLEKIRSLEHLLPGQCANIYCITEDTRGYLWIGTKGNGLYIVHRDSLQQRARHFELPAGDTSSNAYKLVYTIMQDQQQRMWIGTFGSGLHLAVYKGGNNISFRQFFKNNEAPVYIRCLLQDKHNRIWAGTNNGLLVFDPEALMHDEKAFTTYQSNLKSKNGLASNEIKTICEDHKGRIWIGTTGGGFSQFMPRKRNFITYTTRQGLSHDIVNGMLEDLQGNLWISTENGVTRFNPEKRTFEIFYFANNTLGNLFSEAACSRTHKGQLLLGSLNGFYSFYPEQLKTISADAAVILTGLNIAGNQRVNVTKEITLEPGQKIISIEFASLAFKNPLQNKYTYILDKYEDEWNTPSSYNIATYRNLPPGKYKFRVRGTNDDGTWSKQEATIQINVLPPLWRSNPAIVLYLFILLALILGIRYVTKRISRLQHAVELEKQLTEYKLNFFTNISHEFRTPLSLIMSAMESMSPGKHLHMMQKHVTYLMRLADQLLDFRKIQHKKMQLQVQQTDVISFLRDICDGFNDQAAQKQISLDFHSNVSTYSMWIDTNKLDKMLYNLLSNAFKFTPAGGHVVVQVRVADKLHILVSDSGISIPAANQHLVFQKFTQLNFSPTGTGIGLSLTKELAELHKGNISFHNNPDAGVTFTITLPLGNIYSPEETVPPEMTKAMMPAASIAETEDIPIPSSRYKVLIIEDNPDICEYLTTSLGRYFHIHTANNGREGLAQAIAQAPDLVVCDVMLPEMNGLEIVQRIRNEFQTCHIPVILLTALSSGEHQLKGIDAGADAYITKPFSIRFLLTNIIRIIEQREKIRKRFANDPGFFAVHISENEADQQFLDKLNSIIDKNIDNPQFSVDEFATAMKLGRTLFYKKIKGLTGYSPNEYIRLVRVKKASELLNTGEYTIAEVAYKIGMNDPFYFSKCFKAQFGVPPSVHLKKLKTG